MYMPHCVRPCVYWLTPEWFPLLATENDAAGNAGIQASAGIPPNSFGCTLGRRTAGRCGASTTCRLLRKHQTVLHVGCTLLLGATEAEFLRSLTDTWFCKSQPPAQSMNSACYFSDFTPHHVTVLTGPLKSARPLTAKSLSSPNILLTCGKMSLPPAHIQTGSWP